MLDRRRNPEPVRAVAGRLVEVPCRYINSAMYHLFGPERPYYVLVNTDGAHAVSWLPRESCKPGHVPSDESLLIVQVSRDWTLELGNEAAEQMSHRLAEHAARLLDDERLTTPDWSAGRRWSPALPDGGLPSDVRESVRAEVLYLVGDGVAGTGRIHASLGSGLEAGDRLAANYRSRS